jgi:ATP-dependent DNA ligase
LKDLAQWIAGNLRVDNAVIAGEIACVDDAGRSVFNDLLFRRRECLLFPFDLLHLNGEDLRSLPLIERKARLKRLLGRKRSRVFYVDHIERRGQRLFEKVCDIDLEGIVAKRKDSLYRVTEKPSPDWVKIKNPRYSQAEGREELFDPAMRVGRSVLAYKDSRRALAPAALDRHSQKLRSNQANCLDQLAEAPLAFV